MGFFDKIKASIGVGGATIAVDAPLLVTANADYAVKVTVTGGKLAQKLNAIDLALTRKVEKRSPEGTTTTQTESVWTTRKETAGQVIEPGQVLTFELSAFAPPLQTLFDDPNDFGVLMVASDEELAWATDAPMPFASAALPQLTLVASADIPGAIDPADSRSIIVLPEAEVPLAPASHMSDEELSSRLGGAQQVWAMNHLGDQWFVWWTAGMATVACAELKAVASVRPEGVVRTYTNDRVPKVSVLDKQSNESAPQRPGGLDEAFDWARELAAQTNLTVLPRPVGNAVFALDRVQIRSGW